MHDFQMKEDHQGSLSDQDHYLLLALLKQYKSTLYLQEVL